MPTITAVIGNQEIEAFAPAGFTVADYHREATADSGAAYHFEGTRAGRTVHCEWCSFTAPAPTKTAAVEAVQQHYDDLGARVEITR